MSRLIIFGATGSLGGHVLRQALAAGHQVTVLVRTPAKLPPEAATRIVVHQGNLCSMAPADLAQLIKGHDALINCAGVVTEGETFTTLIDQLVTAVESLPAPQRPVCWFLAGAALLDIDQRGRKGVKLPKLRTRFWPHQANFTRISRSSLNWRILCPGPMVDEPALGVETLRISSDSLPVQVPKFAGLLPRPLLLPLLAYWIPQMIVPYADAAALMLANLHRGDPMSRHRVGLALPVGKRGKKPQWVSKPRQSA